MSGFRLIQLLVFASMLSACSQFGPFVDRRREAGGLSDGALYVGKSKPEAPAVCYNRLYTKYTEVKALADAEPHVVFGGRLGEYKYYDMDKVIESALRCVEIQLEKINQYSVKN